MFAIILRASHGTLSYKARGKGRLTLNLHMPIISILEKLRFKSCACALLSNSELLLEILLMWHGLMSIQTVFYFDRNRCVIFPKSQGVALRTKSDHLAPIFPSRKKVKKM